MEGGEGEGAVLNILLLLTRGAKMLCVFLRGSVDQKYSQDNDSLE